jgi:hypothetical protein
VPKAKTAAELRAENRILRQTHISQSIASVINTAIRWGAVTLWVYCGYLSVDSLAGKETEANILVKFLGNLSISQGLAYALAGASILYGMRERRLRKKTVERIHPRVQQLEKGRDPRRTSSHLTPTGETNPKDVE